MCAYRIIQNPRRRIRQQRIVTQRPLAMGIHGHGCSAEDTDGFREIDLPVDLAALGALFLTSTFGKTMPKLACNANAGNRSAVSDCCNAGKASSDSDVGLLLRQAFRYRRHHRHCFHPCAEPRSHTKPGLPLSSYFADMTWVSYSPVHLQALHRPVSPTFLQSDIRRWQDL